MRGHNEGSIYQRKDGRWVGSITLENHKRRDFYGKTRREVQEKIRKALHDKQQGTLMTSSQQTMEQFLKQWLEDRKSSVRARTYERYEGMIRLHLIPEIGHVKLQKLTATHLKTLYAKKLKAGLSPTTVNSLHFLLHKAIDDAIKWELLARNVCDAVDPPRRAHYEISPLTVEQAQKFREAAKEHSLEALWILAITTGMRRGELLALKWRDIDFKQNMLQVRRTFTREPGRRYVESDPKTKKSKRSIMLTPMVVELLKKHRAKQLEIKLQLGPDWQENDLVFCTSLGTPLNPNKVLDRFKTLLKRADLPHIRFHDLRHSAATLLLGEGVNPK